MRIFIDLLSSICTQVSLSTEKIGVVATRFSVPDSESQIKAELDWSRGNMGGTENKAGTALYVRLPRQIHDSRAR